MTEKLERQEDFEAWLAHPMTKALMAKAERIKHSTQQAWLALSWTENVDTLRSGLPYEKLAYLRGKYDTFNSLSKLKYSDLFKDDDNGKKATEGGKDAGIKQRQRSKTL